MGVVFCVGCRKVVSGCCGGCVGLDMSVGLGEGCFI